MKPFRLESMTSIRLSTSASVMVQPGTFEMPYFNSYEVSYPSPFLSKEEKVSLKTLIWSSGILEAIRVSVVLLKFYDSM